MQHVTARVACLHRWMPRPDKAVRGQSRYQCELCGCWGHVNLKHGGRPRAYRKLPHDLVEDVDAMPLSEIREAYGEGFFHVPEGF